MIIVKSSRLPVRFPVLLIEDHPIRHGVQQRPKARPPNKSLPNWNLAIGQNNRVSLIWQIHGISAKSRCKIFLVTGTFWPQYGLTCSNQSIHANCIDSVYSVYSIHCLFTEYYTVYSVILSQYTVYSVYSVFQVETHLQQPEYASARSLSVRNTGSTWKYWGIDKAVELKMIVKMLMMLVMLVMVVMVVMLMLMLKRPDLMWVSQLATCPLLGVPAPPHLPVHHLMHLIA